ncbi:DGQHR domain-containing protein [Kaistia adipata]|uniref:DGQHR domain-containing protein n=1 Tax=Kaistia adipata TaxID=166954 RepID=UPI000A074ABA|nr:DGQHR domain-containing protein [Kaistia adipata]
MVKKSVARTTQTYTTPFLETHFGSTPAYTFAIKARDLITLHYVAVRGRDDEEGAVQRPLNARRINGIRTYILDGNTFFNSFILNWTDQNFAPSFSGNKITLPIVKSAAQVIDGQHRLAGLSQAIDTRDSVGDQELLVTLCVGLTTSNAAKIFLNINTEQKPVPKSLIYDLFGEVVDDEAHAVNRSTDLARELNDDPDSPLYNQIKFPGAPRGQGSIELSTFVSAFKDHFKPDTGTFYTYKIRDYERQKAAINNFFQSLYDFYDNSGLWNSSNKNPFLKAAGFNGAVDFFVEVLIKHCAEKRSFSTSTMKQFIGLDQSGLVTWDELRGKDGKTARKAIRTLLESNSLNALPDHDEYEF